MSASTSLSEAWHGYLNATNRPAVTYMPSRRRQKNIGLDCGATMSGNHLGFFGKRLLKKSRINFYTC